MAYCWRRETNEAFSLSSDRGTPPPRQVARSATYVLRRFAGQPTQTPGAVISSTTVAPADHDVVGNADVVDHGRFRPDEYQSANLATPASGFPTVGPAELGRRLRISENKWGSNWASARAA
jgi:hypothetical protein